MLRSPRYNLSTGIARAVLALGSQRALAERLLSLSPTRDRLSHQAVQQWLIQGYVPVDRAAEVAAVTGVPVRDLVDPRIWAALSPPAGDQLDLPLD